MSDKGFTSLLRPVRGGALFPYLGQIGLALAALTVVPTLVAALTGNFDALWRYLLVILGLLPVSLSFARRPAPADLQANEGLVIMAAVFLLSPFIMAFPLSSAGIGYGQALFEAVSAVTTTGLSTLPSLEDKPTSFLFARAWMQWYGGLGIVVLLPLWLEPGPAARQFVGLDQPEGASALTSARFHARRILGVYLSISGAGFVLLWLLGADPFAALLYSFAAVSTGGFAPADASLAAVSRPVALGVTLICLLGALPFVVYLQAARGRIQRLWRDVQLRGVVMFGLVGTACLAWQLQREAATGWVDALFNAGTLAFSAQTTAGFSPLDVGTLGDGAKVILLYLMVTGGCLGSTAGGIKIVRVLIFAKLVQLQIRRTALPRAAWLAPRLDTIEIDPHIAQRALLLVVLFMTTIGLSWLPFVLSGEPPLDALFEVISAVCTVGLSSGISRPGLAPMLQGILCADMWLGRLEVLALLVLFSPATWHRPKESSV